MLCVPVKFLTKDFLHGCIDRGLFFSSVELARELGLQIV